MRGAECLSRRVRVESRNGPEGRHPPHPLPPPPRPSAANRPAASRVLHRPLSFPRGPGRAPDAYARRRGSPALRLPRPPPSTALGATRPPGRSLPRRPRAPARAGAAASGGRDGGGRVCRCVRVGEGTAGGARRAGRPGRAGARDPSLSALQPRRRCIATPPSPSPAPAQTPRRDSCLQPVPPSPTGSAANTELAAPTSGGGVPTWRLRRRPRRLRLRRPGPLIPGEGGA